MQKPPKKPVKPGLLPQETGAGAEKNRSDKRKQQAPEQDGTGNCGWTSRSITASESHGPNVLIYRAMPMPEVGAMQKPGAVSRPGLGTLLKDISLCLPRVSMSRASCKNRSHDF
jgi:hypothetical protein